MEISYHAYSDESYFTVSRYRSISVVTLSKQILPQIKPEVLSAIIDSGLKEFKWQKLRQARERFAAIKMIDIVVKWIIAKELRVDTIIWDITDSRHQVLGRDDNANLQRMYFFLFRNVLQKRWPTDSSWELFPDENSIIDWDSVQENLDVSGLNIKVQPKLSPESTFRMVLFREFRIQSINEVHSEESPLCQVADLFAGIGAYSHTSYGKYKQWKKEKTGQTHMKSILKDTEKLSNGDKNRCEVMNYLNRLCKKYKLTVSLDTFNGFRTFNPKKPVNFWLYEPQHPDDKAPIG